MMCRADAQSTTFRSMANASRRGAWPSAGVESSRWLRQGHSTPVAPVAEISPAAETRHPLCYCTLLYNEAQLTELRVLGRSIETTGADRLGSVVVPKIVLVTTPDISVKTRGILQNEGWVVKPVETIVKPDAPPRWRLTFTKLKMYSLHESGCAKVAYVDADVLLVRNPTPTFLACPGFCATVKHSNRFNSGVIVLTPGDDILKQMTDTLQNVPSYDGGDQGMLNTLYPNFADAPPIGARPGNGSLAPGLEGLARLPPGFNADIGLFIMTGRWAHAGGHGGEDALYIVHYTLATFKSSMAWVWWSTPAFQGHGWLSHATALDPQPVRGVPLLLQALMAMVLLLATKGAQRKLNQLARPTPCEGRVIRVGRWACLGKDALQFIGLATAPSLTLMAIAYSTPLGALPVDLPLAIWWAVPALVTHACLMAMVSPLFGSVYSGCKWWAPVSTTAVFAALAAASMPQGMNRFLCVVLTLVVVLPILSLVLAPSVEKLSVNTRRRKYEEAEALNDGWPTTD